MRARNILLLWGLHAMGSFAQQNDVPLNRDIYYDIDRNGACIGNTMHTSLRPIIENRADLTNVMGFRPDSSRHYYVFTEKVFKEHLIQVKEGEFRLTIDPAFRFEMGKDWLEQGTVNTNKVPNNFNSRGFWIKGDLGRTVSFQTTFYETQSIPPVYLYLYSQRTGVVPGQGRIKAFNARGLDFAWAMGNVSWSPKRWINVQLGNGRHFIGNGYRSVLLSDNTYPYPYLKLSAITNDQRIQYASINAKLTVPGLLIPSTSADKPFYWKNASFHHLSVNLGRAQIGLFESTVWENIDLDSGYAKPFNAMEAVPVIGVTTAVNGFGKNDKQLVGLDLKVRLTDKVFLYGQFAVDDPERQRYAYQAGVQWFDLFFRDLHFLIEYDHAEPFMYTNTPSRQSYTHFGQPLAHPLGAAFDEVVGIMDLGIKEHLWLRVQASLANVVQDTSLTTNSGGDLFANGELLTDTIGPVHRTRGWVDVSFTWRLNQMTNLGLVGGWRWRGVDPAPDIFNSSYFYIGFCTGLFNRYYDL